MGTRADFYVGRGPNAEWIGSIAWDGYPTGHPAPLIPITDEVKYRAKVAEIIRGEEGGGGTTPDQGWPWPWENSNTTDYSYAFDEGRVWGTCFGYGWWPPGKIPDEHGDAPQLQWPNMKTDKAAPVGSDRSGTIVITRRS